MQDKFRRKLERMGVTKGLKSLQSPSASPVKEDIAFKPAVDDPLPGRIAQTAHGPVWVDCRKYGQDYTHGRYALGDIGQALSVKTLTLLGEGALGPHPAFLDTETTGLAGGAGTLVFLTGVGLWDTGTFTLYQVFLRDPAEESAALRYLTEVLAQATGLVTFNGRGFDVPMLRSRCILNRILPHWVDLPHLDLLMVARQLWRDHLPSRRLGVLEQEILGVIRTGTDVPSWMIPELYVHYLKSGETGEMARIFYHNLVDVLSLVTLLAHMARVVVKPQEMSLAAGEWVGVGRVYDRAEQEAEALAAWELALSGDTGALDPACAVRLWRELSTRYKRYAMWNKAIAVWDAWSAATPLDVEPLVERAKYYEWQIKDVSAALDQTHSALDLAAQYPRGYKRDELIEALKHRQARLERKIARQ